MKKKLLLSIALMVVMLALAAGHFDRHKFVESLGSVRTGYLVPMIALLAVGQALRAVRWWLLVEPVKPLPLKRVAPVALAGFMAIVLFPLRAGEAARPLLLRSRDEVPFAAGLATVLAERVADAITIFLLLVASLAVLPSHDVAIGAKTYDLHAVALVLLAGSIAGMAFLAALIVFRGKLVAAVETLLGFWPKLAALAGRVLGVFVQGLDAFRAPRLAAQVAALTATIWALQTIAFGLGLTMFGFATPASAALPVLAVTMAGIVLPAGIGMSGNFEVFCKGALMMYAVDGDAALAYGVVLNVLCAGVTIGMGLLAMPLLGVKWSSLAGTSAKEATT